MKLALCALACLAVASAQGPPEPVSPCVAPTRWYTAAVLADAARTAIDGFASKVYKNDTDAFTRGPYIYDSLLPAKRIIARWDEDGDNFGHYDILERYDLKKAYAIDQRDGTCKTYELTKPFHPHAIDTGARSLGIHYIGSIGDSVAVTNWVTEFNTTDGTTVFNFQSFTAVDCIPLVDRYMDPTTFDIIDESFDDIVQGLPSVDVFDVPAACTN